MQDSVGQDPVVRMNVVSVVVTIKRGVSVLRHREKHGIRGRQEQADEPQHSAHLVHFSWASTLHAGDGVNNGEVAIKPDAGEEEASAQQVEVLQHALGHAEEVSENPADGDADHLKGKREQEQEVSDGEMQQVDLCDAQAAPTPQQDSGHQAISCQTKEEDDAVEHRLDDGVKALQAQLLIVANGVEGHGWVCKVVVLSHECRLQSTENKNIIMGVVKVTQFDLQSEDCRFGNVSFGKTLYFWWFLVGASVGQHSYY